MPVVLTPKPAAKTKGVPLETKEIARTALTERKIKYPELAILNGTEVVALPALPPITLGVAKLLMGFETETEYTARMLREHPEYLPAQCKFVESRDMPMWLFTNKNDEKVIAWNNDRNRSFELPLAQKYAQTILNRQWAGPMTMPGQTINGETIVIGRSGQVLSGQHRLAGLYFAVELWHLQRERWKDLWRTEPVLEGLIVLGISEEPMVVDIQDNGRQRNLADTLYAGEEFRSLLPSEREETTQMLSKAVELLWKRTAAEFTNAFGTHQKGDGGQVQYYTIAVAREFLHRHERLKKCVKVIFDLNGKHKGRHLSNLGLKSPGELAALLYLMGSSLSDVNAYRNADPLPKESALNWDRWDDAVAFITKLAKSTVEDENPVRIALSAIADSGEASGNRHMEKYHCLAQVWELTCKGEAFTHEDLDQAALWVTKRDLTRVFTGRDLFGGIDMGQFKDPDLTEKPTPEDEAAEKARVQKARQEAEEKRQAEKQAAIDAAKGSLDKLAEQAAANAGKGANGKALTAKQVQQAQTAKAAADDAAKASAAAPATDGKKKQPAKKVLRGGTN